MLWYITYNRIECGVPFLLYDKFFITVVRVAAHGTTVRPVRSTREGGGCGLYVVVRYKENCDTS